MKSFVVIMAMTLLSSLGFAALSDYSFQQSAATYTVLANPTQIYGPGVDDSMSWVLEIGFTFMYDDIPYTQFKANTNGFITLNPASSASLTNDLDGQILILGALWDDLKTNDGNGHVAFQLSGTAPNQVLTVEFKNMKWYYSSTNLVNFQIKLYQGTNQIEFIYGAMDPSPGTNASASIGLSGEALGNYLSVTPASPTATVSSTSEFTAINGSHIPFLTGNKYTFAPLPPANNDLGATGIAGNQTPSVGAPTIYTVTIYNRGSNAQSTYTVQLIDASNNVLASVPGTAVASGATIQVQVSWTPAVEGPVALRGKVVLAGDENSQNDVTNPLNIAVMPQGLIMATIGDGDQTMRMPLDFYFKNSLNETLYYPTEIGMFGNITAVSLYNQFYTNLPNMPTKIWMGSTQLNDLSTGWIPSTQLTQVFDGNVNYPSGENTITIPLQTPFAYTGGNLVVLFNRPMDTTYYSSNDRFKGQAVGTNRARNMYSDSTTYDPANPTGGTVTGQFAKTSFHFTTIYAYLDLGQYNTSLPGNQSLMGRYNYATGITGEDALNIFYAQSGPYPTSIVRYQIIDEDLNSNNPEALFSSAPNNITTPQLHSNGENVYIVGLYNSGGRDPVYYNKYNIASGTMSFVGSESSWPTSAFSDVKPSDMLWASNGTVYMLSMWRYNGWSQSQEDLYIRYSTDEMQSWGSWVQGAHLDGEGDVVDTQMVEGEDGFLHLALWVSWGGDSKIAYFKYDMATNAFTQRTILGMGSNANIIINNTTGVICVAYNDPQGKMACRYSSFVDTNTWSPAELILADEGGIWGTSNSVANSPYDRDRHYYMWNSPTSRHLLQWNGADTWFDHGEIASTMPENEFESGKIYRLSNGDLHAIQGYKASSSDTYYTHLEKIPATGIQFPYSPVYNLTASGMSNHISLTWQCDGIPLAFRVYRDRNLLAQTSQPSFEDNDVVPFAEHVYYITAVYATGNSYPSQTAAAYAMGSMDLVSTYDFSSYAGSYTEITGGTVLGTPTNDNESFNDIPLGFTFNYHGTNHSVISVQSNGFIAFGSSVASSYLPLSSTTGTNNVAAAFSRDIKSRDNGELSWLLSGVAPNRVFTIQWKHYRRIPTFCATDDFSFQIQLHESGNQIKYVYGPCTAVTAITAAYIQVGLRGDDNTDFNNRTTTTDWTATTAGTANNANCTLSATVFPPLGLTFIFAPTLQGTPPSNLAASAFEINNVHLNWTAPDLRAGINGHYSRQQDLALDESVPRVGRKDRNPQRSLLGYVLYRNGAPIVNITDPATLVYDDLNLAAGTYQYYVSAYYDDQGESLPDGPATVEIILNPPQNVTAVFNQPNVDVSWTAPATRSLQGYQVWRLSSGDEGNEAAWTLLTPSVISVSSYIDTGWSAVPAGFYKYAVKAIYSGNHASLASFSNEIEKVMIGILTGTVSEIGTGDPIEGALITAGTYSGSSDAQGTYGFPVFAGSYEVTCFKPGYQVAIEPGVVIVAQQTTTQNFILADIAVPPIAVQAEETGNDVAVSWRTPGTVGEEWLHYDSGENNSSIGTGGVADFDVAIRFPGSALTNYAGMSLQAVKAWPVEAGSFSIRVWTGGTPSAPATMVVDQPFTPTLDTYNTVALSTPVPITGTDELWFGYRCNVTSGYPAGCDAGPQVEGFGNMIYYQGAWSSLTTLNPSLTYNWNIQGYVGLMPPASAPAPTPNLLTLSSENDNQRLCLGTLQVDPASGPESRPLQLKTEGIANWQRSLNGYSVWRLPAGQESNEAEWTLLTADVIPDTSFIDTSWYSVADGDYRWAVKSVYSGNYYSIAVFSNVLTQDQIYPAISVDPSSIAQTMETTDSRSTQITITNTGNDTLDWTATAGTSTRDRNTNILMWTRYTDMGWEYNQTVAAIQQFVPAAIFTSTTTENAPELQTLLANHHILVIPEQESGGSVPYFANLGGTWSTVLQNFVLNGGIIILCGSQSGAEQIMVGAGLVDNIGYTTNLHGQQISLLLPDHYLSEGIVEPIYGTDACWAWAITDPDIQVVASVGGNAHVWEKSVGTGAVVGISYDYYDYDTNAARFISNAVIHAGQISYLLNPASGSVNPGSSANVLFTTQTDECLPGVYQAQITFFSNDPATPTLSVPVTTTVSQTTNPPQNVVATANLNYVDLGWSAPSTRVLQGYKLWRLASGDEGDETAWMLLTPTPITGTTFTDYYPQSLPAGNYKWAVKAVYSGNILSEAAISNELNLAMQFPQIALSANSLSATMLDNTTAEQSFTIHNNGNAILDYSIVELTRAIREILPGAQLSVQPQRSWNGEGDDPQSYQRWLEENRRRHPDTPEQGMHLADPEPNRVLDWLTENPASGAIPASGSALITVTFNSAGLSAGAYLGQLQIQNNDPYSGNQLVDISLNVIQANYTTIDNENNAHTGVADGDLDVYLYNTNALHPIEFNIFVSEPVITDAQLSILAWDIDETNGEVDHVYINGHFAGALTGANSQWSTSVFILSPAWINPGPMGVNLVQVYVDVNHSGSWATTVDWGQLVLNQSTQHATIRSVTLTDNVFAPGMSLSITQEVDTNLPSQVIRIETNILDPSGINLDGASAVYTISGNSDDPVTVQRVVPAGSPLGEYSVQTIVYDNTSNIQQDLLLTPFTVIQANPLMSFDPPALDFGTVYVTDNLSLELTISNQGYNQLNISQMSIVNPDFHLSATSLTIPRMQSGSLTINYIPTQAQRFTTNLNIMSNSSTGSSVNYPITAQSLLYPVPLHSDVHPDQITHEWLNQWQVLASVTFTDSMIVDAATLEYRFDRNGNGVYDATETWAGITGYENSEQIVIEQPISWRRDGDPLCFEFRAQNLRHSGWSYTGFSALEGISDDYYVRLDATPPWWMDVFAATGAGSDHVDLQWEASYDLHFESYEIFYADHPGVGVADQKWDLNNDPNLALYTTLTTAVTGLSPGVTYYFVIRGRDFVGNNGDFSDEVSMATSAGAVVQNPGISYDGSIAILTWDAFPGAVSYNVYKAPNPEGPWQWYGSATGTSLVVDTADAKAFYQITAISTPAKAGKR